MSIFSKARNETMILDNNYESMDIINGDIVRVNFRYGSTLSLDIRNEFMETISSHKYDDINYFKRAREEYLYENSYLRVNEVVGTNPESGIHRLYEARYPSLRESPFYINQPYIRKMRFYIKYVKKKRNYK